MKNTVSGIVGLMAFSTPILSQSPDIILIITDQQTASAMSCAGNLDVRTPALDELANDGILFERAYVSHPLSGPSRASLFTGKMPCQLDIKDNSDVIKEEDMQKNLGYRLSTAGYDCYYAGKWHIPQVNIPKTGTGFTKVCDMNDPDLVEQTISYLSTDSRKPLFLVASFLNPHEICEYARQESLHYGNLPEPALSDCPMLPANFPEPPYYPEALTLHKQAVPKSYPTAAYSDNDWRKYLYAYYRLVERVDKEIGKLIVELKKADRYDRSLILFVSDHGDGIASHQWNQKRSLQEEVIKVPFIVKPPVKTSNMGTKNTETLINTSLDIYQTVCDYAGAVTGDGLLGKSIRPVIEGKTTILHRLVFAETFLDGINARGWCVVDSDYKYVIYRYFKNREQFFCLSRDPGEMQNLIGDKTLKAKVDEYRRSLHNWGVIVNDPLLIRQLQVFVE